MLNLTCWMKNSTAYAKNMKLNPKGIVIHSSGRNMPYLYYYVQPSKSDPEYDFLIKDIGYNKRHNDYNHTHRDYDFHYWIGKRKNGQVVTIMTYPWYLKTWNDDFIHIFVCEDDLNNEEYLRDCLNELIYLCNMLCQHFNWDSDKIYDHSEISNLPDINYWLKRYGYNVQLIRDRVDWLRRPL